MLKLVRALTAHAVDVIAKAVLHPRVAARQAVALRTNLACSLDPLAPTLQQIRHSSIMPHQPLGA